MKLQLALLIQDFIHFGFCNSSDGAKSLDKKIQIARGH